MKKILVYASCLTVFAGVTHCQAAEIPVNLKAQNFKFAEESGIITASGSVEISFRNLTIEADTVLIDTNKDTVSAQGNLTIKRDDYSALAQQLHYDASNETAVIENFSAFFKTPQVRGTLYLKTKNIQEKSRRRYGTEGLSTTCDQDHPHYELKATNFLYIPKEILVGYNVTCYIGPVPVIWAPVYIYSLKKRRVSLLFPVIGKNEVEGDFVKNTVSYFIDEGGWGSIYLDLMSKKGFGKGLTHNYTSGNNAGEWSLYQIDEQDTKITGWVAKIKNNLTFNQNSKLGFGYEIYDIYAIPGARLDQTKSDFSLNHNFEKHNLNFSYQRLDNRISNLDNFNVAASHRHANTDTNFSYVFNASKNSPKWTNTSEQFNYRTPTPFWGWDFYSHLNYFKRTTSEGLPADERLDPQIEVTKNFGFGKLKITENWYLDPDKNFYTADDLTEYLERLPEATLTLNPLDLRLFKLSAVLGAAQFRETKYISQTKLLRDFTSHRYLAGLNASQSLPLPAGTTANVSAGLEQFSYDPGDQRYILRETHSLNTRLFGFFKNEINYKRAFAEGNTPFFFETSGSNYHDLTERISFYYQKYWDLSFDGGYNYRTKKYLDLNGRLSLSPTSGLQIYTTSGYDIENRVFRDWYTRVSLNPYPKTRWDLNTTYNLNSGELRSAQSLLDFEIGNSWQSRWHFKISHLYDFTRKSFNLRDLEIGKDLHCWEATFSYAEYRKEYRLTFKIKAFPDQPLSYISGSQGQYFEGFFKEKLQQPTVQRY